MVHIGVALRSQLRGQSRIWCLQGYAAPCSLFISSALGASENHRHNQCKITQRASSGPGKYPTKKVRLTDLIELLRIMAVSSHSASIRESPTYLADDLTKSTNQAQIVLGDQNYILRITRAGKLILTK